MTDYVLEIWDTVTRRYIERGRWNNIERAEIMFNKPYWKLSTRRLLKIDTEILYMEKGKKVTR